VTRICLTTVTTTPISRVSCWRRKLWRPFEVQLHRRHEILGRGREENWFDSYSFRGRNFCTKIKLWMQIHLLNK
jgi:hypothetical protein